MKFLKVLILSLFLYSLPIHAQSQTWEQVTVPADFIKDVIVTKEGIVTAENDSRLWRHPNNSAYISKDLGITWKTYGLMERGVTDLTVFNNEIYATSFYVVDGTDGLFRKDGGQWVHLGPIFSANHVSRDTNTIYTTGISHGLWISTDEGATWEQKIGDGWYGPEIKALFSTESFTMAADTSKVYVSTDKGDSWKEVPFLTNKGIDTISGDNNNILAAGSNGKGMFVSSDLGVTWTSVSSLEQMRVTAILSMADKTLIIGNAYNDKGYCLYISADIENWTTTGLCHESALRTLAQAIADKTYIFGLSADGRLFKAILPKTTVPGILGKPWENSPLAGNITSYFDHEYPLKFYRQFPEPLPSRPTTLNFLGEKEPEPVLYYSGHNGIDFGLEYGTEVKATAKGRAFYYQCYDCGHTIHIVHDSGLESWYMHLQKDGLIVQPGAPPVNVTEGQTIGKVGMTGNTTGPHLHFGISQSNKAFPDGYFDPFGWQNTKDSDPWKIFTWTDINGGHAGTASEYLWKEQIPQLSKVFEPGKSNSMDLENVTLTQETPEDQPPVTLNLTAAGKPYQENLRYIPNTSVYIQAWDLYAGKLKIPVVPFLLEIVLEPKTLKNVLLDTVALYALNETTGLWEKQASLIDTTTNKLVSNLAHLSHFAVFAEDPDGSPPITLLNIEGEPDDSGWYEPPVLIGFTVNKTSSITYYSLSGESGWEQYKAQFTVNTPGINIIWFRSVDENGHIGKTQRIVIKVKGNDWIRTAEIKRTTLAVSENYSAP